MSDQQPSRQLPKTTGSSHKPDAHLRLVGKDGQVVIPEDAAPTDNAATVISKKVPAPLVGEGEALAIKNLRGQHLAHFELLEPIGVGGMAAVMRARDTQLDRFVALKILPPDMAEDGENIRRFHQEARAAAKLDHPNIAQVFFCGEDRNLHFIAFEFVEGENLRTLLERRGRIPVPEAVRYLIQVATGLDHAASRGVVHRDIKPSNIIITPMGGAKLVDMGLARSMEPHGDQALTQSGMTLGTFDYISPEQALEPREADVRSDIYSLGCTFYHMLTGQPPAPEGTAAKKLYHHQHLAPIDPRQLNPAIPDEIAAILMKMMCKDPKDRYQKPVHLVQHLLQVAQKVGAGADVPEGAIFLDAPMPGPPQFRPLLTIALAGLALGVLLLLVSLASDPGRPTPQPPAPLAKKTVDRPGPDRDYADPPAPKGLGPTSSVGTASELDKAVKQGSTNISIVKDFTHPGGLSIQLTDKKTLDVNAAKPAKVLRFKFNGHKSSEGLSVNLEAGCTVTFSNIRFEASDSAGAPLTAMLAFQGPGQVIFDECYFKGFKGKPLTPSILLKNADGKLQNRTTVQFKGCFWEQGQAAVAMDGPALVDVKNCAFGPHNALFHLYGKSLDKEKEAGKLSLHQCSAFVVNGPAFRLDCEYGCALDVQYSIFSYPFKADPPYQAQLIHSDAKELMFNYVGKKNCYHNLSGLLGPDYGNPTDVNVFNLVLSKKGNGQDDSKFLSAFPWANEEQAAQLANGMYSIKPSLAFQLRDDPAVQIGKTNKAVGIAVGIEYCAWGKMNHGWPADTVVKTAPPVQPNGNDKLPDTPPPAVQITANDRIVDPDADEANPPRGTFRTMAEAFRNLGKGGVIYLKHGRNRQIQVQGIDLVADVDMPKPNLTVKPYPNDPPYQPVLVFTEQKRWMFLHNFDGKLAFENLEFLLAPEKLEIQWESVVAMANEGGQCSFKNCVFTLKRPDRKIQLSAVRLKEPDADMKMPRDPEMPARDPRQVSFTDCLVRGEGDLAQVRDNQPFDLYLDNCLVALHGSLLSVSSAKAMDKEMPGVIRSTVKLSRVSAFLKEKPLVMLNSAGNLPGLAPIRFEPAQGNLFAALDKQPFIVVEGGEMKKEAFLDLIDWKGEKNAYVNFDPMYQLRRSDDWEATTLLTRNDWGDMGGQFFSAKFSMPAGGLSDMSFDHFKPQLESQKGLAGFGAALEAKMLPRLSGPR